jgi:hypothetical protein
VPFAQIASFVEVAKGKLGSQHPQPHQRPSIEFVSYPGEGHGMTGTAAQKDVLKQMEQFLKVHLKPWNFTDNPHGDLTSY